MADEFLTKRRAPIDFHRPAGQFIVYSASSGIYILNCFPWNVSFYLKIKLSKGLCNGSLFGGFGWHIHAMYTTTTSELRHYRWLYPILPGGAGLLVAQLLVLQQCVTVNGTMQNWKNIHDASMLGWIIHWGAVTTSSGYQYSQAMRRQLWTTGATSKWN